MNARVAPPHVPVVQTHDGVPMADSRDVARYFHRDHKSVLRSIKLARCSVAFRERNFAPAVVPGIGGEDVTSHVLMTKNGFAFVVLAFTGEPAAAFREDYILAFDRMEAELRQPVAPFDPMTFLADPRNMMALLGNYAQRNLALEAEVEVKTQALALAAPMIATYEAFLSTGRNENLRTFARLCDAPSVAWFTWMKDSGFLFYEAGKLQPRADLRAAKVMVVKQVEDDDGKIRPQTLVTPDGQIWLQRKWVEHLEALAEAARRAERQRRLPGIA